MNYHLISEAEEQCDLLYQREMQHSWQDPVVVYIEVFLEAFSFETSGIKTVWDCKYVLQLKILLLVARSFLNFISIQEVFSVSWMLSWLHWKHDFT